MCVHIVDMDSTLGDSHFEVLGKKCAIAKDIQFSPTWPLPLPLGPSPPPFTRSRDSHHVPTAGRDPRAGACPHVSRRAHC